MTTGDHGEGEDLQQLESTIGYEFDDRALLARAMTHRSYANEHAGIDEDNQRLEFLGDAVLGTVIAEALFQEDSKASEGGLSSRLSELVCEAALVERAGELQLGDFLRLGRGEEMSGGRRKEGLLADAYEALLGAVFVDGGFEPVQRLILEHFEDAIQKVTAQRSGRSKSAAGDFKSLLQREVQSRRPLRPEYRVVDTSGPPHDRRFVAQVTVEGREVGRGVGRSKKEAEQGAAAEAVASLEHQEGALYELLAGDESESPPRNREQ